MIQDKKVHDAVDYNFSFVGFLFSEKCAKVLLYSVSASKERKPKKWKSTSESLNDGVICWHQWYCNYIDVFHSQPISNQNFHTQVYL